MANRGLLLTITEPPPAMEEEFNAWYDDEHLPERLAIPGFRSARRWTWQKSYLATYELDSPGVLNSPQYLSRYENPTPWTKRCLGRVVVFKRWACEQLGSEDPHPGTKAMIVGFDERAFSPPGMLQARRFAASSGESITLYELAEAAAGAYELYKS
ncbi:MAG TPA: hypothetical protein VGO02_04160 [Burkholderiales bacterium]|jgi:hypothetical protein|nr:hypothetical protein [Burkholderiales bacterium]